MWPCGHWLWFTNDMRWMSFLTYTHHKTVKINNLLVDTLFWLFLVWRPKLGHLSVKIWLKPRHQGKNDNVFIVNHYTMSIIWMEQLITEGKKVNKYLGGWLINRTFPMVWHSKTLETTNSKSLIYIMNSLFSKFLVSHHRTHKRFICQLAVIDVSVSQ